MNGNRLRFEGLDELREALRRLPEELRGEASRIVEGAANGAAAEIKGGYPVRSGHLRDGLVVTHFEGGKFSAGAIVKNTAKHAWLFDNGSEGRHYVSKHGKRHFTGRMPPRHVFVRGMIRARKLMYTQLADLLRRHGLLVEGTP